MQSYRDLIAWQKSIGLVRRIYRLTANFPKSEMFGLTSQMRRSAVSIPANIAEGYSRKHRAEYVQFLRIAYGSGAELETYFVLLRDFSYVDTKVIAACEEDLFEVMRLLNKLIASLEKKS